MSTSKVIVYHAAAGTGKTTTMMKVLEEKVRQGYCLNRIAYVTFTKAAAQVAQERVCQTFGIPLKDAPHFRTIHSMCFRATNAHRDGMMDNEKYAHFGSKAGYSLGNVKASSSIVDGVDWTNVRDAQLVALESLFRNNEKYAQERLLKYEVNSRYIRFATEYNRYKQTFGYVDFTDLLERYIERDLSEDVDLAFIDEAQDCTPLQWHVLMKAFRHCDEIYIAGDSAQTLYTYTGCDSSILENMRGEQRLLELSYRVPSNILTLATQIRNQMVGVIPLDCKTTREGGQVEYISRLDDIPSFTFDKSYFFLCRNKKFCRQYIEWCEAHYLPYRLFGEPQWSDKEKQQFRDGRTDGWDSERLRLAQEYHNHGTFYRTPNIDIKTIHGVKGDEADVVVLMGDLSKLTYNSYSDDPNNEHKVFYVAATRAKETLYILPPQTKLYYGYIY